MFGPIKRMFGLETRSAIDVGALYAGFFQFGSGAYSWQQSPVILVSSLSVLDNAGALLTESRRRRARRRCSCRTAAWSSPAC